MIFLKEFMKKFDLIDINEDYLPDVNLSDDQKKKLKKIFKDLIKPYLSLNHNPIKIDLSTSKVSNVTNELGNESDDVLNYVKGGKILRNLVIEALDKDCPLKDEEILYKTLLYIPVDYSFKSVGILYSDSVFSHRIYVTQKEIFMYNLDNYFRVINTTKLPINSIKSAFINNGTKSDFMPFSCNTLTLDLNNSVENNLNLPSTYYLIGEKGEDTHDLQELLNTLKTLGVKTDNNKKTPYEKYALWIINIITFLFIVYLIFSHFIKVW